MALITWNPALSVDVELFDEQHKKLIDMINDVHDAMKVGKGNDVLGAILSGLVAYTATHFADEERLMDAHDYPDRAQHKLEHRRLVRQVIDLQKILEAGRTVQTLDVMMFLKDWLVKHIQGNDSRYGAFFNDRGVK